MVSVLTYVSTRVCTRSRGLVGYRFQDGVGLNTVVLRPEEGNGEGEWSKEWGWGCDPGRKGK